MSLLIDVPISVSGNTNNGNTARRFFRQPQLTSSITGVDKGISSRFHIILTTLSCGYNVNVEAFEAYTKQNAEEFVKLYPWFFMPNSVHKVLVHGADIIVTSNWRVIGRGIGIKE